MNRPFSKLALAVAGIALVTACAGGDNDADSTTADTTTVPGMDTVNVPTAVPTTDTVITDTTVKTDTIRGGASDTTRRP